MYDFGYRLFIMVVALLLVYFGVDLDFAVICGLVAGWIDVYVVWFIVVS